MFNDTAILVWMALALVMLHCLTNNQYGFHWDELNFIEDGRHLAWGYIDCPPFTPFVAHIAEMLFGTTLVGIRFFPAVAQGLVLVLTGLMVRRMGGNRWARIIGASGAAISPVSLSQGSIFMYVSFDFLWWVVVAYGVISLLKTQNARWWLAIGAAIGLGLMTKLTMSFLVAGVVAAVLFTAARLDRSMAPRGQDTLIAIVPVGHMSDNGKQDWASMRDEPRQQVFHCMRTLGMTDFESHIKFEETYAPPSWRKRYNLVKGSTHGLAHTLTQLAFFRPSNRHARYKNLYFVGASTHPGTGIPTAMVSGRLVSERIMDDLVGS